MKRFASLLFTIALAYGGGCLSQWMVVPAQAEQGPQEQPKSITADVIRVRHIELVDQNGRKRGELMAFHNSEGEAGAELRLGMRGLGESTGNDRAMSLRASHGEHGFSSLLMMGDGVSEYASLKHDAPAGNAETGSHSTLSLRSGSRGEWAQLNTSQMFIEKDVVATSHMPRQLAKFLVDGYSAEWRGAQSFAGIGFSEQGPAYLKLRSPNTDQAARITMLVPNSSKDVPVISVTDPHGKETFLAGK